VLAWGDTKLAGDQQQSDTRHEDNVPLEELAGGGQQPDEALHRSHRGEEKAGAVRPHRQLIDIVLALFLPLDTEAGLIIAHHNLTNSFIVFERLSCLQTNRP
jgi:hypothetical protein